MNTADPAPRPSPDGLAAPSLRSPLPPGSLMLGVLGGGQLGRMFVHAAQRHGYRVAVLEPDAASPAGAAADLHLDAPYTDPAALAQLRTICAAVTTEFENVPAATLSALADSLPVSPPPAAVQVLLHRQVHHLPIVPARDDDADLVTQGQPLLEHAGHAA